MQVLVWYTPCMSRPGLLILLGIIVLVIPFSGLPMSWRTFFLAITGLVIVLVGVSLRSPRALPPLESKTPEPPVTPPQAMG